MWRRKARTILTMIGVIIGSSAILTMVSIGNGFQSSIMKSMSILDNANMITVISPSYYESMGVYQNQDSKSKFLTDKNISEIEKIEHVKYVSPKVSSQFMVNYKKNEVFSLINGVNIKSTESMKFIYGKELTNNSSKEAVIGYKMAAYLLDKNSIDNIDNEKLEDLIRKRIKIILERYDAEGKKENKEVDITICGILEENGPDDFNILVPIAIMEDFQNWVNDEDNYMKKKGYQQLEVMVDESENVSDVEKKLKDMKYQTSTLKEAIGMIDKTLGVVKIAVGAIGAISLIVAAFGIMNTMNMSIYERTKEIGVMKVVGAAILDVKKIFVFEAAAIGFIGGVSGITFGLILNYLINIIGKNFLFKGGIKDTKLAVANIGLIIFVLTFATLIGLVSGLYPASRAAKLNVINALKDE